MLKQITENKHNIHADKKGTINKTRYQMYIM